MPSARSGSGAAATRVSSGAPSHSPPGRSPPAAPPPPAEGAPMLAIITDSTSDLTQAELAALGVDRVVLYVAFQGKTFKDWVEITPKDIIAGVQAGADLPSTSQPSPEDF